MKTHANFLLFTYPLNYKDFFMRAIKFTSWQDGPFFVGFLNEFPDYQTQGMTKEELIENLKDLLNDIESAQIPYIRKVEELLVA
jgi:predicted RNase H-like HicB family nuclease